MAECYVGKREKIQSGTCKVITAEGKEIGIFYRDGQFYAYDNYCLHQGGPACEGVVIGKVEQILTSEKTVIGERFSDKEIHFVCPWHGWEYDLATGECTADRRLRLKKYEVIQKGNDVYVVI